jgi:Recombination endonuclease VII
MSSEQIVAPSQEQTKQCIKCDEVKSLSAFSSNGQGGKRGSCKVCCGKYQQVYAAGRKDHKRTRRYLIDPPKYGSKFCKECGTTKDYSQFFKDKCRSDGYCRFCKDCKNKKMRIYSLRRIQETVFKDKTLREIEAIYAEYSEKQQGLCAICRQPEDNGKRMSIDHCHVNGNFRGLLCWRCNVGLGHFRDNPALLQNAISYLQKP